MEDNQYIVSMCLTLLKSADRFVPAAEIAERLHIGGKRETQRRVVREMVKTLRQANHWIVASLSDGYYLTTEKVVWQDYLDGRQIDAKRILGESGRRKRMVADKTGQGLLFCSAK